MTAAALAPTTGMRARAAAETTAAAVALGLLADLLFREAALGLNGPLWLSALLAALWSTGRHRETRASGVEVACYALSFGAAATLAWRGPSAVQALMFLASGAFLVAGVAVRTGLPWRSTGVALFLGTMIAAAISVAAGAVRAQSGLDVRNRAVRRSREGAGAVIRTVLIGAPVLLVFAGLFASADAVFEDGLERLTGFDLSGIVPHVFWFLAGAWFAGGVTWAAYDGWALRAPQPALPDPLRLGPAEVTAILGALATLFAAFVLIQLRYLFGGHDLVQQTTGLTYAEYARRGFFELVAAAVLLLPLLLVADWARRHGGRGDLAFRVIAGTLVALLFVIVASAVTRMLAYDRRTG